MTKQIFSSHKNPHYYYEKKTQQYMNENLRASRLLRSYPIDELKKLNFFLKIENIISKNVAQIIAIQKNIFTHA